VGTVVEELRRSSERAGADVTVTGPLEAATTTAADGSFAVDGLLEGDYEVTATAEGYLPASVTATVVAGTEATADVTLAALDVAVLGDVGGALVAFLRAEGVPAVEIGWSEAGDLDGYEVAVVNGGDPDAATFEALLDAADAASTSLVFSGTWGVTEGGLRLLERHTDDVTVGGHGYGDGLVGITAFDPGHPLFAGLDDPATILADGG
jgi:hypothetical protein